jgi:hypothetical protein
MTRARLGRTGPEGRRSWGKVRSTILAGLGTLAAWDAAHPPIFGIAERTEGLLHGLTNLTVRMAADVGLVNLDDLARVLVFLYRGTVLFHCHCPVLQSGLSTVSKRPFRRTTSSADTKRRKISCIVAGGGPTPLCLRQSPAHPAVHGMNRLKEMADQETATADNAAA